MKVDLKGKKRVLVTSALTYVNNVPHLGNLICVLSADVYRRFLKKAGVESIFVFGTDEHGTTTETKARELNLTPRETCDKFHDIHTKIYNWFSIDPDCYGRTSDQENHQVTREIYQKLNEAGYILEQVNEQAYCQTCQTFLSDRFVSGTCPHCNYEDARGDQCDGCGKLLQSTDLINAKCKTCGNTPSIKSTKHLYIDLPKIEPILRDWMDGVKSDWSANARTTAEGWLKEGMMPRAITRDLKWGVKIPREGYEEKVFYCWFDAPIGYISITKKALGAELNKWWHDPKDTRLIQFMGKDNIVFHSILFPSFELGTNDNYTIVDKLAVNEFLNYENDKFSKSRGIGVFGDQAMETGIDSDLFRFYLMYNRPENADTNFIWQEFMDKVNKELVGNLGNLFHRTFHFIYKFCDGLVPKGDNSLEYKELVEDIFKSYEKAEYRQAVRKIMALSDVGNRYFQENEPWKLIKEDRSKAEIVLGNLANLIVDTALLISPIVPKSIAAFIQNIKLDLENLDFEDLLKEHFEEGHKIAEPKVVFSKIDPKEVKKLQAKFAGKSTEESDKKKKQKKEKKKVAKIDFSQVEMRVGIIEEAEKHPKADKLLIEKISLGEFGSKQIISGISEYYSPEEIIGKKVIVVSNLKAAKLRGVLSEGMVLAVSEGDNLALVTSSNGKAGDLVTLEGTIEAPGKFVEILIDQFFTLKFELKDGKSYHDGKLLVVNEQVLVSDKEEVKNGLIS